MELISNVKTICLQFDDIARISNDLITSKFLLTKAKNSKFPYINIEIEKVSLRIS